MCKNDEMLQYPRLKTREYIWCLPFYFVIDKFVCARMNVDDEMQHSTTIEMALRCKRTLHSKLKNVVVANAAAAAAASKMFFQPMVQCIAMLKFLYPRSISSFGCKSIWIGDALHTPNQMRAPNKQNERIIQSKPIARRMFYIGCRHSPASEAMSEQASESIHI